jgi:hypothetical protein
MRQFGNGLIVLAVLYALLALCELFGAIGAKDDRAAQAMAGALAALFLVPGIFSANCMLG